MDYTVELKVATDDYIYFLDSEPMSRLYYAVKRRVVSALFLQKK